MTRKKIEKKKKKVKHKIHLPLVIKQQIKSSISQRHRSLKCHANRRENKRECRI